MTTTTEDSITFHENFSFKNRMDMSDAQTGDDELKDVAFDAPASWTPRRNETPPSTMPKTPESAINIKFLLLNFNFLFHGWEITNRNMKRRG